MAAEKKDELGISDEVLDKLLAGRDPATIFESGGVLDALKKRLAERMLSAEMEHHLGLEAEQEAGNHRNGYGSKTVLTDTARVELAIPRDRQGRFDPVLIAKYRRRFPGFDERIIALYARGMTTREIQAHIGELYGIEISPDLVSTVTDSVIEEVGAWQGRGLESTYAIVFFDAIRVKIRSEGLVHNRAVYLAIGMRCSGHKEILGIWIEQTEGAKFWLRVMTELRNRGTQDILIAVVDGLKGFPEAIESIYPKTEVQHCVIHQIRNSMKYVASKNQKAFMADLKCVYKAATLNAAEIALDELEAKWGDKYPMVIKSWRSKWSTLSAYFKYPDYVRTAIYTTNAVEAVHRQFRKLTKTKGGFPNENSLLKLLYAGILKASERWTHPAQNWNLTLSQLAIHFEGRLDEHMAL